MISVVISSENKQKKQTILEFFFSQKYLETSQEEGKWVVGTPEMEETERKRS